MRLTSRRSSHTSPLFDMTEIREQIGKQPQAERKSCKLASHFNQPNKGRELHVYNAWSAKPPSCRALAPIRGILP